MKFLALILALVATVWATAIPAVEPGIPGSGLTARADDEWELVIYPKVGSDEQCGGTSQSVTGASGGGSCLNIKTTACADIKINAGFASCSFLFKSDGCNSGAGKSVDVDQGSPQNNVRLPDVKFVTVQCSE